MKALVLAAAFGFAFAAPAAAEKFAADDTPNAVPIRYADLDLNRTEDAEVMLNRLRAGASRACDVRELARPGPAARRAIEACRAAALESAVNEVSAPELTRLHREARRD